MYRENYINSLHAEIVEMVANALTPVALHYGYNDIPLESTIKWRPQVLVIGNYSSGKSTLINELLGIDIQATGQAPTDDSFTIITFDQANEGKGEIRVTEERDGKFLLNDPEYPFEGLKKYGQRFAAHFCLKKVNSPFLKNISIIDTPGMLDSITERDRGYNYQEVIGDLAHIADLIMVLFDPHKAGTVREAHTSLRDTLPSYTFEDRVLFVLNRIDECSSLLDLLRVYGTLCWNLSQITGRKDIPMIRLTYSPKAADDAKIENKSSMEFVRYLKNQREEIKKVILDTPRKRLDHLATFVETHSERLSHFMEALISFRRRYRKFHWQYFMIGLFISLLCGGLSIFVLHLFEFSLKTDEPVVVFVTGGIFFLATQIFWLTLVLKFFRSSFLRNQLANLNTLTPLKTQNRIDSWQAIHDLTQTYIRQTGGKFSLKKAKQDFILVKNVSEKGTKEIREALNELSTLRYDDIQKEVDEDLETCQDIPQAKKN